MGSNRFAAIDLGSNTFRFLIASTSIDKPWQVDCYKGTIVRLGEGLQASGVLCAAAMQRGEKAIAEFRALLDQHHIPLSHVRAVSTAAMRSAANSDEFIQRVLNRTGIQIEVISGDEEAATSLLGSCAVLDSAHAEDMLLFDIGGGSTEFVRAKQGKRDHAISCPLGVVRLVEAHLHSDPPSAEDYQCMISAADQHLEAVQQAWQGREAPASLVGTAGTVTTMAATLLNLYPYQSEPINNFIIHTSAFSDLRHRLLALTHAERQQITTIEPQRADLMIAGCAIIDAIFERWGHQQIITVDAGLLEGVWLKLRLR